MASLLEQPYQPESPGPGPSEDGAITIFRLKDLTLPAEPEQDLLAIQHAFRAEHRPVGPTENYLVEQLVCACWRRRRLARCEVGLLQHQTDEGVHEFPRKAGEDADAKFTRLLGIAFDRDCSDGDCRPKLSRCDMAEERSFLRCLQQLRRLQDARNPRAARKA